VPTLGLLGTGRQIKSQIKSKARARAKQEQKQSKSKSKARAKQEQKQSKSASVVATGGLFPWTVRRTFFLPPPNASYSRQSGDEYKQLGVELRQIWPGCRSDNPASGAFNLALRWQF
jgi:hypothetical protein